MSSNSPSLIAYSPLERIGFGHCGSVWSALIAPDHSNMVCVLKREDASPGRDIKNEVTVQSQAFATTLSRSSVPQCLGLMDIEDERWSQLLPRLPRGYERCRAMVSEKIDRVSLYAQRLLINKYCPEEKREELLKFIASDDHCLVRIYLGRRRQQQPAQHHQRPRFFSLRNFPMHADQAEELELPCDEYARAMAEALATLHWKVRTNGADVEFVLGAPRVEYAPMRPAASLGEHAIWMLDFDCSRPIKADESGLESIARAFWRNDPYYPQSDSANKHDQELWEIFATEYRQVGKAIVQAHPHQGESVEELCALVDGALAKIVETKGKWKNGPVKDE